MSIFQKARDKVLEVNDKIDGKVDGKIDKAQKSRFSWLRFGGAVVVMLAIIVLLAKY